MFHTVHLIYDAATVVVVIQTDSTDEGDIFAAAKALVVHEFGDELSRPRDYELESSWEVS